MKAQIEEMAKKICGNHYKGDCVGGECVCQYECIYAVFANRIYNAGYRKQKKGEWLYNRGQAPNEPLYFCSLCAEGGSEYGRDNFCPNCGAKMKGGAE